MKLIEIIKILCFSFILIGLVNADDDKKYDDDDDKNDKKNNIRNLIVRDIRILSFGTHYPDPNGGTITLNINGSLSKTGNSTYVSGASVGSFTFRSTNDFNRSFIFDMIDAILNGQPATSLIVNNFVANHTIGRPQNVNKNKEELDVVYGATVTYPAGVGAGLHIGDVVLRYYTPNAPEDFISVTLPARINFLFPPLTITETTQINFGKFGMNPNGGTIRMSPTGVITNIVGVSTIFPSTTSNGLFRVTGAGNTPVYLSISQNNTLTSGANSISFTNVISNSLSPITLNANGIANINVGGDIVYAAGQPAGVYRGNYTITVNY